MLLTASRAEGVRTAWRISCKRPARPALTYVPLNRHRSSAFDRTPLGRACRLHARVRRRLMPSLPAYTLEDEAPDEADHTKSLTDWTNPRSILPTRRESTRLNATPTRQLSQSGGR